MSAAPPPENSEVDVLLEPFVTQPLDRVRIQQFTVAMRDPNPVHTDAGFCRSIGLPGIIAPGSMAVVAMAHSVARHYGLERIREIDVKLRAPVALGERLVCSPRIVEATADRVEFWCVATNEAGELRAEGRIVAEAVRAAAPIVAEGSSALTGASVSGELGAG